MGWVAEWPPFEKELFYRLTICSLCFLTAIIVVHGFTWVYIIFLYFALKR